MPSVSDLQKRLTYLSGHRVAASIWSTPDVLCTSKARQHNLTKKEADEIIDEIDHEQDCSVGINWDVIESAIENKISQRKK